MLTASQIRAGRALIGLRQIDLAAEAGISEPGLKKIELELVTPQPETLEKLERAFAAHSVEFEPNGVRLRQ